MNKKNLILYFDAPCDVDFAYQYIKKMIRQRQEELLICFPQEKVDVYMARGQNSYIGENIFRPQFQKIEKKWQKKELGEIEADLVLGFPIPNGVTALFPSIRDITLNKTYIEALFPKYTIPSKICESYTDIYTYFSSIQSQLKVLKPACGTRGKGIFIQANIPQKKALPKIYYPYILQEFFDTSTGWEGIPGYHDFRVLLLNGEIIGKFLRQPKSGSYLSNSHKKGNFQDMSEYELPEDITLIVQEIDSKLALTYPIRYYSIDFGRNTLGNVKIFEMNSAPGLSTPAVAHTLGNYIAKNILKIS